MNTLKRSLAVALVSLPLITFPFFASALSLADIKSVFEKFITPITLPSAFFSQFAAVGTTPVTNVQLPQGNEAIAPADLQELRNLTKSLVSPPRTHQAPMSAGSTGVVSPPPPATTQVQNAVKEQVQLAVRRKVLMEMIAKKSPEVFLQNVMPSVVRAKLSSEVQAHIERQATLTGTTEVLHIDDFEDPENSRFQYHLRTGNQRTELSFVGDAPLLSSGATLRVEGFQIGNTLAAEGGPASTQVLHQPVPDAVGVQKTFVILVTSPGMPAVPTPAEVKDVIFNGAFQEFYREQSYGKVSFEGDVTDWISVPPYSSGEVCPPSGPIVDIDTPSIRDYFSTHFEKSHALYNSDRIVFLINGRPGGCGQVGKYNQDVLRFNRLVSFAWVGYPASAWNKSNMAGFEYLLSHEMGHLLGVMHANSWFCTSPSLDRNCEHREYGNLFDVMGKGTFSAHFNAFYKDLLGWFDASSKVTIDRSNRYTLAPLEVATGPRVGIINHGGLPPLYIEFRQPTGFDADHTPPYPDSVPSFLRTQYPLASGLFLNQVVRKDGDRPYSRLLNANYARENYAVRPLTPPAKVSLIAGNTFDWPGRGIKIYNLATSSNLATFDVQLGLPVCESNYVGIQGLESKNVVGPGETASIQFRLVNNGTAACFPKNFRMSVELLRGGVAIPSTEMTISAYPSLLDGIQHVLISPGESQLFTYYFQTSESSPSGVYYAVLGVPTGQQSFWMNITGSPNLTAGSTTPTVAITSAAQTFSSVISNRGSATNANFQSYFEVTTAPNGGGIALSTDALTTERLGSSASRTITQSFTLHTPGTYSMRACADGTPRGGAGTILESNETDNCGPWTNVVVSGSIRPNLIAGRITPTTATSGVAKIFSSVIYNTGATSTPNNFFTSFFQVAAQASGGGTITNTPHLNVVKLGPNESRSVVISRTFNATGTYSMRACADSQGLVQEINETDNCGGWTNITVTPRPDRQPIGYFERATCSTLIGWAYDPDYLVKSIDIHVYEGDVFVAGGKTGKVRPDINNASAPGFAVPFPESLKDGRPHTLKVYAIDASGGATPQLTNSPRTITCAAPTTTPLSVNTLPRGNFEAANCTFFQGWTYDPNASSTSIGVVIKEGDIVRVSGTANVLRTDVNIAKGITGNHGFSIPTPESLKDNVEHNIRAYGVDSSGGALGELFSGPRTVRCDPSPPEVDQDSGGGGNNSMLPGGSSGQTAAAGVLHNILRMLHLVQ